MNYTSALSFHFSENHASTNSVFKRLIDLLGSIIGLIILALVFVPIAIAIKLDSPGPIFYSQQRHGLYGKPFQIYKFRSMVSNADSLKNQISNQAKGAFFKNEEDSRVTQLGKILRRNSLDELPQFWNILVGEMSLVGTRPPTCDEVINYNERHWQRLNVKPGLTGQWQVSGRSQVTDFETVVDLDLRYQNLWSPWYYLKIVGQTIYVVLLRDGAC